MNTGQFGVRRLLVAYSVCVWISTSFVAALAAEPIAISGVTMGTSYSVKIGSSVAGSRPLESVDAPSKVAPYEHLQNRIRDRLAEIDQRMSTYRDDSEVTRFNRSPANEWFTVSAETAQVVQKAMEVSEQTAGAFDITVGPLVRLWNFGPSSQQQRTVPSDSAIEQAKTLTGYSHLGVRLTPPALRKAIDALEIDLSGIAKGYAVDQVAIVLESEGISNYLVEIGGEIRTSGQRSMGDSAEHQWIVGIESPQSDKRAIATTLALKDAAMASSGDYRNFFEVDGVRYSHTIDPRTGRPIQHSLAAATVVSSDCATADALATALLVMGDDAETFAERYQIRSLFFAHDGTHHGQFTTSRSTTFPPVVASVAMASSSGPAAATSYWRLLAASIIVIGIALIAMAVGVIFSNRCVKGSCGGMEGLTDEHGRPLCEGCSNPSEECTTDPTLREHAASSED